MATISHMKEEMVRLHLTWNLKCLNEIVRKYEPSDSLSRGPLVYASLIQKKFVQGVTKSKKSRSQKLI